MVYSKDLDISIDRRRLDLLEGTKFRFLYISPPYSKLTDLTYTRLFLFFDVFSNFFKKNFLDDSIEILVNDLFLSYKTGEDISKIKKNTQFVYDKLFKSLNLNFDFKLIFSSEIKDEIFSFFKKNTENLYSVFDGKYTFFYFDNSFEGGFQNNNSRKNSYDFSLAAFQNKTKLDKAVVDDFIPMSSLFMAYYLSKKNSNFDVFVSDIYSQKINFNVRVLSRVYGFDFPKQIKFSSSKINRHNRSFNLNDIKKEYIPRLRHILLNNNPEKPFFYNKKVDSFYRDLIFEFKEIYYESLFIYGKVKENYVTFKEEELVEELKETLFFSKFFSTEEMNYSKGISVLIRAFKEINSYYKMENVHSKQTVYEIILFLESINEFYKFIRKDEDVKFLKLAEHQESLISEYTDAKKNDLGIVVSKIDNFLKNHGLKLKHSAYGYFLIELNKKDYIVD